MGDPGLCLYLLKKENIRRGLINFVLLSFWGEEGLFHCLIGDQVGNQVPPNCIVSEYDSAASVVKGQS